MNDLLLANLALMMAPAIPSLLLFLILGLQRGWPLLIFWLFFFVPTSMIVVATLQSFGILLYLVLSALFAGFLVRLCRP